MKKSFILRSALCLGMASMPVWAMAQPATPAPVPPEFGPGKVMSVYSDSFSPVAGWSFGEWGSGTVYAEESVEDNKVAKFVTGQLGYFGWVLSSAVNAATMDKLHIDFYSDAAMELNVYPICTVQTAGEKSQHVAVEAGTWTSVDLDLSVYTAGGLDLSGVKEFKFGEMGAQTLYIDNVYFYSTSQETDTEKPAGLTATLVSTSFNSVKINCVATDNSGAVNYRVTDAENGIDQTFGGVSGTPVEATVSGLKAGTSYHFSVTATDLTGNESDAVAVDATTLEAPEAAPAPTNSAANVISIYSDAYEAATWFNIGGWGQATAYSEVEMAAGNKAMLLDKFDYIGLELNNNVAAFDASEMEYLHVDVWSDNATLFQITPIWGGVTPPGEKLYTCTPLKQGEWNSFDIPLSAFDGINLDKIYQFKMVAEPAKAATVFVDNIYLYKEEFVEDTEAPAWSADPAVKSVTPTSAVISVQATDNLAKKLTYEVSATDDFSTIAASAEGATGVETEVGIPGLTASTEYTFFVRATDAQANVSEVKSVTFTSGEADMVIATFYGQFLKSDWEEKGKQDGQEVTPVIDWKAETTASMNVIVTAKLGEALPAGVVPKFCAFVEGGIGQMDNLDMTPTANANEYTISLAEKLPEGKAFTDGQIFGQFFFRIYPQEGVSRTKILTAYYKVGASNEPPTADTEAPVWSGEVTASEVADRTATLSLSLTDDSGSAIVTVSGDNFTTVEKTLTADGTVQTIDLSGLTPATPYILTLTAKDAAGNAAAEEKVVTFTTGEEVALDPLYLRIPVAAEDWNSPTDVPYKPTGDVLITVLPDNRLKFTVTLDEMRSDFVETLIYIHGFEEGKALQKTGENVLEYTTEQSVSDRNAQMWFHMYFVYNGGTSTYAAKQFVPGEGSTSGVETVGGAEAEVYGANGVLNVVGAAGKKIAVYTVSGMCVYDGLATDSSVKVELPGGIYVAVVGGKAVKVVL